MSSGSDKSLRRLELTYDADLKVPDCAALLCHGGAVFGRGISIGNNNSSIPGSLRYNEDTLQLRHDNTWVNVKGFVYGSNKINSVVKINEDNFLENTDIIIDQNTMSGLSILETEHIVSPENKNLHINNTQWPTETGQVGNTLIYSSPGILSVNTDPLTYYTDIAPSETTCDGKKGTFAFDSGYLYVCIEDNLWKKVALNDI